MKKLFSLTGAVLLVMAVVTFVYSRMLMVMTRNNLYILLLLILTSCNNVNDSIHIEDNYRELSSINNFIDSLQYVQLKTPENIVIGNHRKILYDKEVIYVSDGKKIYTFNNQGQYLSTLDKKGRSLKEYYDILDFIIHNDFIFIIDRNASIYQYTLDGEYINSKNLNFYPATLYTISDNKILLSSAYQTKDNKFQIFDIYKFAIESSFIKINDSELTYRHLMGQNNYYCYDGNLIFHEPMNNIIYKIAGDTLKQYLNINLFNRNAPKHFWLKNFKNVMVMNNEAIENNYCFGFPEYAESDKLIIFTYRDADKYRMCIYDKKSGNSTQFGHLNLLPNSAKINISEITWQFSNENSVLFIFSAHTYNKQLKQDLSNALNLDLSVNDNPIVGIGRIK